MTLQVCCTANVFNVLYLAEVADWISAQGFDFVYWNMLHDAPQHCIANLPESAKKQIADRLMAQATHYQKDLQGIVDFMFSRQGTDGRALKDNIKMLDQRRGQNLRTVEPELAEILNYD
jgi:hypothetical protein